MLIAAFPPLYDGVAFVSLNSFFRMMGEIKKSDGQVGHRYRIRTKDPGFFADRPEAGRDGLSDPFKDGTVMNAGVAFLRNHRDWAFARTKAVILPISL
jgi:hypothetical protein